MTHDESHLTPDYVLDRGRARASGRCHSGGASQTTSGPASLDPRLRECDRLHRGARIALGEFAGILQHHFANTPVNPARPAGHKN